MEQNNYQKAIDILHELFGDYVELEKTIKVLAQKHPDILIEIRHDMENGIEEQVAEYIRTNGGKIPSIKYYRDLMRDENGNMPDLRESKEAVDEIAIKYKLSWRY